MPDSPQPQPPVLESVLEEAGSDSTAAVDIFPLAPLIRITLLGLYFTLTVPLPYLATATNSSIPAAALWAGIALGAIGIYAALTERVILNSEGIQVAYPAWVPKRWRPGWQLAWDQVQALKPRTTGQGGLVYYLLSRSGEGYLLPMRVAGFARLVRRVQAETGLDMTDVKPLAQPWMYFILLGFTLLLVLMDAWTITTAMSLGAI
jgi:hypothetical protein